MLQSTTVSNIDKLVDSFIEKDVLEAGHLILKESDIKKVSNSASAIANAFGVDSSILKLDKSSDEKLISSFINNLTLLIQKTWIEKADTELKEQVLYQLDQFRSLIKLESWDKVYTPFLRIIYDAVYLMFGAQTKKEDFLEYAFRVDPEFGTFWWYIQMLPLETDWSDEKCRIIVWLGMYFLANY